MTDDVQKQGDENADAVQDKAKQDVPAGGAENDKGIAAEFTRPEWLPEHFYDPDPVKALEKVNDAYKGARDALAKGSAVPEKLEDYKVELPEDLAAKVLRPGEDGKDPVFEHMRGIFHKQGIAPDVAIALTSEFYGKVSELVGAAVGDDGGADMDFQAFGGSEKVKPIQDANLAWITGLKTKGVIDDADADEMSALTSYGQGLRFLDKLRVHNGGKSIPVDIGKESGANRITESDLNAMVRDPRYWQPGKKDPAFIQKVTEGFQQLYGSGDAA